MLVFGQRRHSPGAWLMPIVTVSEEVHAIIVVRQPGLLHLAKPIRRLTAREFSWAAAFLSERDTPITRRRSKCELRNQQSTSILEDLIVS